MERAIIVGRGGQNSRLTRTTKVTGLGKRERAASVLARGHANQISLLSDQIGSE
jgi:hypothetical protein